MEDGDGAHQPSGQTKHHSTQGRTRPGVHGGRLPGANILLSLRAGGSPRREARSGAASGPSRMQVAGATAGRRVITRGLAFTFGCFSAFHLLPEGGVSGGLMGMEGVGVVVVFVCRRGLICEESTSWGVGLRRPDVSSGARIPGSDWWRGLGLVWSHPSTSHERQAGRRRWTRGFTRGCGSCPWHRQPCPRS